MKKDNPDKKPTMKEVKNVINNLIIMLDDSRKKIYELDQIVGKYIDFKNDHEKFVLFMQKENLNVSNTKDSGKSSTGDRKPTAKKSS